MSNKQARVAHAIRTNRFRRWPWATISRACDIAAAGGFETVEAEHLLVALTQQADEPTARALEALGMTERTVRTALDNEYAEALNVVGVSGPLARRPRLPKGPAAARPKWGQSATLVLGRALEAAGDRRQRRIGDRDLLIGLSQAEAGVIPRVLATLDVNADDIEAALR
jgi:ATP-dependent Clp protease ATP-binding subunit ClpA